VQSTAKSTSLPRGGTPKGAIRGGRNGSQTVYSERLADEILDRLSDGESLDAICSSPGMPAPSAVRKWARKDPAGFGAEYGRARSNGHELMAEEIIEIGDSDILVNGLPDNALVQRNRLMCDNRKWLLSKLLPRQFGDKVTQELTGDPDRPLVTMIQLVPVAPKRLPKPDDEG
jgi:hypothetical protein